MHASRWRRYRSAATRSTVTGATPLYGVDAPVDPALPCGGR